MAGEEKKPLQKTPRGSCFTIAIRVNNRPSRLLKQFPSINQTFPIVYL
jgi:hypothetical protein